MREAPKVSVRDLITGWGGKFFFEFGLGLVQPFRGGHLYGDSLAGIVAGQPFQLGEPGRGRKLFILDGAGWRRSVRTPSENTPFACVSAGTT